MKKYIGLILIALHRTIILLAIFGLVFSVISWGFFGMNLYNEIIFVICAALVAVIIAYYVKHPNEKHVQL